MGETLSPTAGQTIGPFFGYALPFDRGPELVDAEAEGAIRVRGRVLDGDGAPVPDALLELWQADPDGCVPAVPGSRVRDGAFTGFGRAETDVEGRFWFRTVEPGTTGTATPFFAVTVFARGLLDRLFTRVYLPEAELTPDALLSSLPEARRRTLIATRLTDGTLHFDIRLQGDDETVFLDYESGTR